MTGLTPPSYPTCSPTSAGSDTAGKCRKTAGFYPDFPELVPAIPATKSCDQGSCGIRRIVKRSPGYSGNANPGVRVLVTVRSCDRERSDRPIWTKLAGRAS
ncbi:unnamed protein product [Prunus armeniaca]